MTVQLHLTFSSVDELRDFLRINAGTKIEALITTEALPPVSVRKERASSVPKAAKSESKAAPVVDADEDTDLASKASAAVLELAKKKGRQAAKDVLGMFGADKIPDVKADDYAALIEEAEKATAA